MELLLGEKGKLIFTGFNVIFCGDTEKLLFLYTAVILRLTVGKSEETLLIMQITL